MLKPNLYSLQQKFSSLTGTQQLCLLAAGILMVGTSLGGVARVITNSLASTDQGVAVSGAEQQTITPPSSSTSSETSKDQASNKTPTASPNGQSQATNGTATTSTHNTATNGSSTSPTPAPSPSPTPSPAPSPTGCQPVAKSGGGTWTCTWSDEFSGTSLNRDIWSVIPYGLGNTCQSDDDNHVKVSGGYLQLLATQNDPSGYCKQTWDLDYTGGFIQTLGGFSQKYGRFEMRAKLPVGDGFWPAFWLLPADDSYNAEIDVLEAYGGRDNNIGDATLHTPAGGPGPHENCAISPNYTDAYHTYTMEWSQGVIKIFYDGNLCANFTGLSSEFDQPFHILLDLAVQPWWPPNGSTPFPGVFSIDYVRAWQ